MKINDIHPLNEDARMVHSLQNKIITQVKLTGDQPLLDKIYTVLNFTNLNTRVMDAIKKTSSRDYAKEIAQIIIDTPGTYQEKFDFIKGYPAGYVNVDKLLSGERLTIDDIIDDIPFIKKVFRTLFKFMVGDAGPGEFALAALSPRISFKSSGDLFIDGKFVEVKASNGKKASSGGGRLGTPGATLNNGCVPGIIAKYYGKAVLDKTKTISITDLHGFVMKLKTPAARESFVKELMTGIFKGPVPKLVKAVLNNTNPRDQYIIENFKKYQAETKFTGVLLINMFTNSLQYFTAPEEIINNIYASGIYVYDSSPHAGRHILSQLTLR